jgi:hypothetical protein
MNRSDSSVVSPERAIHLRFSGGPGFSCRELLDDTSALPHAVGNSQVATANRAWRALRTRGTVFGLGFDASSPGGACATLVVYIQRFGLLTNICNGDKDKTRETPWKYPYVGQALDLVSDLPCIGSSRGSGP